VFVRARRSLPASLAIRCMPVAALLPLVLSGRAMAQFPFPQPTPTPGGSGLVVKAGDSTGALVLSGTDQGPQIVQDQSTVKQYAQGFAGTEWSFKETSPARNGVSQGQLTITRGGQPLFKQPGIYFDFKVEAGGLTVEYYDVYYSDKQVIISGSLYRNPQSPKEGSANIFYTVIGQDGTPTSTRAFYPLTFSQ
jgi:hypothetical protein